MEIKKVLERKNDKSKLVIVPKNSDIAVGDYVQIIKIKQEEGVNNKEATG